MVVTDILACLIPAIPVLGFLVIALTNRRLPHGVASALASGAVLISFFLAVYVFVGLLQAPEEARAIHVVLAEWFAVGEFHIAISFLIDPLTSLMMLIITGVGFLIHVYSIGYMHDDPGYNRFFSYLNLFVFFMLLLVMGSNYLVMFVGWEGVGLCSYLLIGFWYKNTSYMNAANKAFIMNRVGDLGLLVGIILLFAYTGSLEYADVFANAPALTTGTVTLITILLFIGAMGKSAQLPLYTWLPDAMAGPTPVSALIHAATMVTAGVYMVARNNVLYAMAPVSMDIILMVGAATALFAATIAVTQTDIKKVLAYSTVSQLGLMFLALGSGAFTAGIFHMATHAFFKALLFLGAGSVIHGLHGEQDITRMGGLKKLLPVTYATFLVGVLAIAGIPPFAGFFSKDEILAHAFAHNPVAWAVAVLASLLTVFYMFRMFFLTFHGSMRVDEKVRPHIHESPASITVPLIVLAVLSAIGGFMNVPDVLGGGSWLHEYLSPVFAGSTRIITSHALEHGTEYTLMGVVIALTMVLIVIARIVYVQKHTVPDPEKATGLQRLSFNKYYVDELYEAVIVKPLTALASWLDAVVERAGIDRLINSSGGVLVSASGLLRKLQTGSIGFYIFMMVLGIVAVLTYTIISNG